MEGSKKGVRKGGVDEERKRKRKEGKGREDTTLCTSVLAVFAPFLSRSVCLVASMKESGQTSDRDYIQAFLLVVLQKI